MIEPEMYMEMANAQWDMQLAEISDKSFDPEKTPDASYAFMRQMRAAFNPKAVGDANLVLEFHFTDIDKIYQFHIESGRCDLKQGAPVPYTTRIETPYSVWLDISTGKLHGVQAMMDHKYKTLGSFDTMMILNEFFSSNAPPTIAEPAAATGITTKDKKANMGMLIIPWLALWIVMPIHPMAGAAIGILSGLYVTANRQFVRVPYETVSAAALTVLSLSVLCGLATVNTVLIAGKSVWVGMWFVSAFLKIPLCAYYSCYGYGFGGPEKAFQNRLFLKTNRILSVGWGVFGLMMSIIAYLFLQIPFAPFFGMLDQIAPLFMGIFTIWFAKWYPARVARGILD